MALCGWRDDGQGDFFQDGDEGEGGCVRSSTSPLTGSNSLAGDPDASAVNTWQATVQAGGAARLRTVLRGRASAADHG